MRFGGVISGAVPGDRFFIISTPPTGSGNRYVQDEVAAGTFNKTISLNAKCQYYGAPEPVEVYRVRDEELADRIAARIELEDPETRRPFTAGEWALIAPRLHRIGGIEVDRRRPATGCPS
jgi:hypothetical protein